MDLPHPPGGLTPPKRLLLLPSPPSLPLLPHQTWIPHQNIPNGIAPVAKMAPTAILLMPAAAIAAQEELPTLESNSGPYQEL